MRFLIMVILIFIIYIIGRYYIKILERLISIKFKKSRKWLIAISFLAYFLAFCTINFFSSLGIFLVHFLVFSLLIEGLNFFLKKTNMNIWNILYKSSVLPLIITGIFFGYGFINIRNIMETRYYITTDNDISLNILFLSDAHYGKVLKTSGLNRFLSMIDGEQIDLVLLGGDIVDENTEKEEMQEIFKVLGNIKSTYGTFFVYGNHDRQMYIKEKKFLEVDLIETLEDNNIEILCDTVKEIGDDILLVGREDKSFKRKNIDEIIEENNKFTILIDHQPVDYEEARTNGVDLILSGHTHAGQIFPAGNIIKLFHMADLWYGYKEFDSMSSVVTSGLAGWGYPIRTQKNSEYVIIEIRKG